MVVVDKIKKILLSLTVIFGLVIGTFVGSYYLIHQQINTTYSKNYEELQKNGFTDIIKSPGLVTNEFVIFHLALFFITTTCIAPFAFYVLYSMDELKTFHEQTVLLGMLSKAINLDDDGVVIMDVKTHKIMYANEGIVDMGGYRSYKDIIDKNISDFFKIDDINQFIDTVVANSLNRNSRTNIVLEGRKKDNSTVNVSVIVYPMYDENNDLAYVHFMVKKDQCQQISKITFFKKSSKITTKLAA